MTDNTDNVLQLDCQSRFEYFLEQVGDARELWILVSTDQQFLIIHSKDDNSELLPVWPSAAFATAYLKGLDEDLSPKSIALPEFFAKWVKGLEQDAIDVSVFPNAVDDVWVMTAGELKQELQNEMNNLPW